MKTESRKQELVGKVVSAANDKTITWKTRKIF